MEREFHITEVKNNIRLDFRWKIEKGKIKDFAINVSLLKNEKRFDVYRVDTKHGYLHEQRFWKTSKPKGLDYIDYNTAFIEKKKEVIENFEKWVGWFEESMER